MKGKKLAIGAALIAVPSLALAAPAAAADRTNSSSNAEDVPAFAYQGNILFCRMTGFSTYRWDESDDRTTVSGYTQFIGSPNTSDANHTRCRNAASTIRATVHWIDGDDELHGTSGTASRSIFIETRGEGPGNVTEVNGNHFIEYLCDGDNGSVGFCTHNIATSPSTK
jgi:hypothetical protein